jgi:hypothetical protein
VAPLFSNGLLGRCEAKSGDHFARHIARDNSSVLADLRWQFWWHLVCQFRAGHDHIDKALDAFREAGIHYLTDASIFSPDDPGKFRFIDFAIEEFPAVW